MDLFFEYRRKIFQIPAGRQTSKLRLKRKVGIPLWLRLDGAAVVGPGGKLTRMRVVASDITERKRAEEALSASEKRLQDLSSKLLLIQELERKSIANEIHDGLLSDLAAVSYSLEAKDIALGENQSFLSSRFEEGL